MYYIYFIIYYMNYHEGRIYFTNIVVFVPVFTVYNYITFNYRVIGKIINSIIRSYYNVKYNTKILRSLFRLGFCFFNYFSNQDDQSVQIRF